MLKNEHRHYALYLPDDAPLDQVTRAEFEAIHDQHWQIKQYYRAIKQVCHIERSQVRGEMRSLGSLLNKLLQGLRGYYQNSHRSTMRKSYISLNQWFKLIWR